MCRILHTNCEFVIALYMYTYMLPHISICLQTNLEETNLFHSAFNVVVSYLDGIYMLALIYVPHINVIFSYLYI